MAQRGGEAREAIGSLAGWAFGANSNFRSHFTTYSPLVFATPRRGLTSERTPLRPTTSLQSQVLPLLRVLAAVAMMSVLYNVLGQSMPYWHVRSVRMRGPGEKINWITRMGLWGYEVRTHDMGT